MGEGGSTHERMGTEGDARTASTRYVAAAAAHAKGADDNGAEPFLNKACPKPE